MGDVLYAVTDEGMSLPVVDVTHPAFAVAATDAELAAMSDQYLREAKLRQEVPATVLEALQRSMLGPGLLAASGTFLTGMNTYLLKLGAENLGTGASPIDHRIAASLPVFASRLRLQDMARLLADGLPVFLAAAARRPLCFINIAGGPAADSWNALIHLRAEHSELLDERKILVAVLDRDDRGPAFGGRAVQSLRASDAPLSGLDIRFHHVEYNWSEADRLQEALDDLGAIDAVCAISSEGGLFEYGSDSEILANLQILHHGTASTAIVVGSVTRDGELVRAQGAGAATRPRTLEAFRTLAEQTGWIVQHVIERPFSYNVRLVKD
jgi:hypothetical protein